jgi:hypothetical protein
MKLWGLNEHNKSKRLLELSPGSSSLGFGYGEYLMLVRLEF